MWPIFSSRGIDLKKILSICMQYFFGLLAIYVSECQASMLGCQGLQIAMTKKLNYWECKGYFEKKSCFGICLIKQYRKYNERKSNYC